MKLKLRRELSPDETARYLNRQHEQKMAREREERIAAVNAARDRDQKLADARERYEANIRGEQERQTAAEEERKRKLREHELERDRQWMAHYKDRRQRVENARVALRRLEEQAGQEADLGSVEAALAAAEHASRIVGGRLMLERAESDLQAHENTRPRPR